MLARFEPIEGRRKMPAFIRDMEQPALRCIVPFFSEPGPCACTPPGMNIPRRATEPRICQVVFEATGEVDAGIAVYREMDVVS